MLYVKDAFDLAKELPKQSVSLLVTDPPYGNILGEHWDRKWRTPKEYSDWFLSLLKAFWPTFTPNASILFFGGIGRPSERMLLQTILDIEDKTNLQFRDWIVWKKRKAYGMPDRYLFQREELLWYSVSDEYCFNVPYLNEKRDFHGWNKDYPAKSEYKRVGNVWVDIGDLLKTRRAAEKPVTLLERIVLTHSNEGDLVVDPFCGCGASAVAAMKHNRRFLGCDLDETAVQIARSSLLNALDSF